LVFVQKRQKQIDLSDRRENETGCGHHCARRPSLKYFAYDEAGNIFINLEDSHSIAVIDAGSKKLRATWPMRWL